MSLHGGDIWNLGGSHGLSPGQVVDFSASLNPRGVPDSVRRLLAEESDLARTYPDAEYRALRRGLGAWLGLSPDQLAVGNGASELIREVLLALRPARILVPMPGFAEYGRAAAHLGIEVVHHFTDEGAGFRLDPAALAAQLERDRPDLVFVCNPNNPSSVQMDRPAMEAVARVASAAGAWLVVDETFIELSRPGPAASLAPWLAGSGAPRLVVLRALTKYFALAGMRLGYLAAPLELAARIRDGMVPWSVNGFAARLGGIFESEAGYMLETASWLAEEPDWLARRLAVLAGPGGEPLLDRVLSPAANFILCRLAAGFTAPALREALLAKGLLIRDCSNFPGLGEQWFRVAVRFRPENERLAAALAALNPSPFRGAGGRSAC